MASPPYSYSPTALSPPYPSHTQLPAMSKKRSAASDLTGVQPPALKRRKASNISAASAAASHPLRQTSFPPEARGDRRSPSVDATSVVSGSQVSGTGQKKKRGRKAKNADAGSASQTPSLIGGKAPTVVSGAGGDRDGGPAEEEDEPDGPLQMEHVNSSTQTKEQKEEEHRLRGMLVEAFDPKQYDRYEVWRIARLSDAVVKRVVNATVSQSVPEKVVLAVKSVSKLFIGDLVESARRVQTEWIEATGERQTDLPTPPPSNDENGVNDTARPRDDRRGPLRPEHLREALRRYRSGGEGSSAGMMQLWHVQQHSGVERFSTKTGRRVFR